MTFSIVARDPQTGALGVATATAGPAVGALVPHGQALVGAVATQAMTNPYLAYDMLDAIAAGASASAALEEALARDAAAGTRQVIMVDRTGEAVGWTGVECQGAASHRLGPDFAVAGNLMAGEDVLDAMETAFRQAPGPSDLSERLLAAMEAGAAAGGDRRGIGSAAIKVFQRERYALLDIRVDQSETPMVDLRRAHQTVVEGDYADFFRQVPRRF